MLLTNFDYDANNSALLAFQQMLADDGLEFSYHSASPPNSAFHTRLDLNADGRNHSREDRQGYGRFAGDGGIALLSRYPIHFEDIVSFNDLLWRDLPDATLPPNMSDHARDTQRFSSTAHLAIPVSLPRGNTFTLLAYSATPPVFDDEHDRNGLRNAAESTFWIQWLGGVFGQPQPPFAILGNANIAPDRGDGRREAIRMLLDHPLLQDPAPVSSGGAAARQGGASDTVDWPEPSLGNMRTTYLLPERSISVAAKGVVWPEADHPLRAAVDQAGPHRLVWADIVIP